MCCPRYFKKWIPVDSAYSHVFSVNTVNSLAKREIQTAFINYVSASRPIYKWQQQFRKYHSIRQDCIKGVYMFRFIVCNCHSSGYVAVLIALLMTRSASIPLCSDVCFRLVLVSVRLARSRSPSRFNVNKTKSSFSNLLWLLVPVPS